MTAATRYEERPPVVVVRFERSGPQEDLVGRVERLVVTRGPVVIDVSAVVLTDVALLRALARRVHGSNVCIVCSRLSGRRLLRKLGTPDIRLFPSVDQAVEALGGHGVEPGLGSPLPG